MSSLIVKLQEISARLDTLEAENRTLKQEVQDLRNEMAMQEPDPPKRATITLSGRNA